MTSLEQDNLVLRKTRELCESFLEQPEFHAIRKKVNTFMEDSDAKEDYEALLEKQEYLNHKQHQGVALSQQEVDEFDLHRKRVLGNPLAKEFLDAQQEVHKIQEWVSRYVAKTFEIGKVPSDDDFKDGCCGDTGCGCH